jgi:hypothetical protein
MCSRPPFVHCSEYFIDLFVVVHTYVKRFMDSVCFWSMLNPGYKTAEAAKCDSAIHFFFETNSAIHFDRVRNYVVKAIFLMKRKVISHIYH